MACSLQRITAPERLRTLSRSDLRIELSSLEARRLRSPCSCPRASHGRVPGEAAHRVSRGHLIGEIADGRSDRDSVSEVARRRRNGPRGTTQVRVVPLQAALRLRQGPQVPPGSGCVLGAKPGSGGMPSPRPAPTRASSRRRASSGLMPSGNASSSWIARSPTSRISSL